MVVRYAPLAEPMEVVIAGGAGPKNRRLLSMACAAGEASVVAVARNGADAIRTVLEEEPDVLIFGPRLPVLRIVAVGDRPGGELRRAFLLGEIDLLLAGPDWADVIPGVLRQWQHEQRREPWSPFTAAPPEDCG